MTSSRPPSCARSSRPGHHMLNVSASVFSECFGMTARTYVVARARRLSALLAAVPDKIFLGADLLAILADERAGWRLRSPIPLGGVDYSRFVEVVRDAENGGTEGLDALARNAIHLKGFKTRLALMSRRHREEGQGMFVREGWTGQALGASLRESSPSLDLAWWWGSAVEAQIEAMRPEDRAKVLLDWKSGVAWSGFATLIAFALSTPSHLRGSDPDLITLKDDKNDWYDAAVGAEAAYSDLLVTDDDAFAVRCRILKRQGFIAYDVCTWAEFLERHVKFLMSWSRINPWF